MAAFTKELVKIASVEDGIALEAWLFKPAGTEPFPVVIAGHGLTVVKDAGLLPFGERWALDARYASLIFDYRYFGGSDGEPRNFVSLTKQREDYQAVLRWVRLQPEQFLNTRIVLMGSALSALTICQLALDDSGLAGVMAHSPMLDGYDTAMSLGFNPRLMFWALVDRIKRSMGYSPLFIKAVGRPGEFAFLNTPSSYQGFVSMFEQGNIAFSSAPNVINPSVLFEIMNARPGRKLRDAHCPVLLVTTKADDIMPSSTAAEVAEIASNNVTMIEAQGGHYDIMHGGQGFEVNINAQLDFLAHLR
ncbi:alpha/beta-hydrolase [Mycena albidolilacea]|uniref:Alpha/beta-hydrolase n=1 Tax=Mycena albidolilacea TaxID=1033008 RepID=A0AAD7EFM6_9AGAR|nr:alpha/beta-hydrolase [Mycena albidolilacea]